MSKTLQEMQIEVARYWAVAEEMNNCPWWIVIERPIPWPGLLIEDTRKVHTRIINCTDEDGEVDREYWEREFSSDQFCQREIQPYLQIEDGNLWSSAAILARCGKLASESIMDFIWELRRSTKRIWDDTFLHWEEFCINYHHAYEQGWLSVAHNLSLQWLHKYAPEVWAKGMEALG